MDHEEAIKKFNEIVAILKASFGSRLAYIGAYGSIINKKDTHINSDIDIYILLLNHLHGDLEIIKKLKAQNQKFDITFQYIDIIRKKTVGFRLGHHGDFYINVLKNTQPIYGTNLLSDVHIDKSREKGSVLDKIEEYISKLQDIATTKEPLETQLLKKYTNKILVDLLLFFEVIDYAHANYIKRSKVLEIHETHGILEKGTLKLVSQIILSEKENSFAVFEAMIFALWEEYTNIYNNYYGNK